MDAFSFVSLGDRCHGKYLSVGGNAPLVVIATGGGNKGSLSDSWTKFPSLLAEYGISSVVFDFAGQGLSDGNRRVLTLSRGIQNLIDVLDELDGRGWIPRERLALMGSSFGGNVVLEYLSQTPKRPIRGASLKSPCIDLAESYLQEVGTDGMLAWEREGYSSRTGLDWSVIEEANKLNLSARLHNIVAPILITHGTSDESVPIEQSRTVLRLSSGVVDLVEMKGVNHHYSERNDWDRMAAVHVGWLGKQLQRHD